MYRLQLRAPRRLGLFGGTWQDVTRQVARAEAAGRDLPVAVAVGLGPQILFGTQARVPYGFDELAVAGAIAGQPVETVRGVTVDLQVPAAAEIVIEGVVRPGAREVEGLFGEFTGYYGPVPTTPVIEVTALTHRRAPIFQAGLTGRPSTENHVLKEIPLTLEVLEVLRRLSPNVHAVHLLEPGASFILAISMTPTRPQEARQVLLAAMGTRNRHKIVIVCDADIDVSDTDQVMWAVATPVDPGRDLLIAPNVAAPGLDPASTDGSTSVLGIDATRPVGRPFPEVVRVPGAEQVDLSRILAESGGGPA